MSKMSDLKTQLYEMQNQIKDLIQQINQLEVSPQNKSTKQKIALDRARENLSQYKILEKVEMEQPLIQSFIALAQNAITSSNNFNQLIEKLKEKMDARNGNYWSIVAYTDSGDADWWVSHDKRIKVDFCGLTIDAYQDIEDQEEQEDDDEEAEEEDDEEYDSSVDSNF